jgi:pyruvate-formate lyase-activating enzyme
MIAAAAKQLGCRSVAFTYNDPVIWAEYAIDTARACRAVGIKTVAVTAGYITEVARRPFYEAMDAANVDLKAFTEDFYQHLTLSHLQPVLDTLVWLKRETNVWFEITNLVIPQANDGHDEFARMCDWILANLGDDVPLHFTAFHPDFRMMDTPNTPKETLLSAYDIARGAGLKYVYTGNVDDVQHQSTYCPACGECVIERNWYELSAWHLKGDRCEHCDAQVHGHFDERPGDWGRRRQGVNMANFAHLASPEIVPLAVASSARVAPRSDAQLSERCRRNIVATLRGQVAEYSLLGGLDGNYPGVSLTVHVSAQSDTIVKTSSAGGGRLPLQSTLFGLCQQVADDLRAKGATADRWPELRAEVNILSDDATR